MRIDLCGGGGRCVGLVAGLGLVALSCGCATSLDMARQRALAAGYRGFVSEIDEPSSRGVLTRVSPDESDVRDRFCLAPGHDAIVFSATQGRFSAMRMHVGSAQDALHLWRTPVEGGSPVKLTSGGVTSCAYPSFTSDGLHIVYSSGGTLWKIRRDGAGGRTRIPGSGIGTDFAPQVSCDDQIVFCSRQTLRAGGGVQYFVWLCDLDGGNLTQLREGLLPAWAPDGKRIVFVHGGDVWTITAEGTELTQLTNTERIYEGVPTFSPDGKHIAYASNEGKDGLPMSNDFNIWTMREDGADKTQITELPSWDSWPVWGPNGIYFLSARAAVDMSSRRQRIWHLRLLPAEDMNP